MNLLFCSVGRRCELVKNFKTSMNGEGKIVGVDGSSYAPALYLVDKSYIVPGIHDENYIPELLRICEAEEIDAVATFIDPEIEVLAQHREMFEQRGIKVLAPSLKSAKLCFDKFEFYKYLKVHGIPTAMTFGDMETFLEAFESKEIQFPVFVKPRTGSGSVGAKKVDSLEELTLLMQEFPGLMIQELMTGEDLDADIYVDMISGQLVSAFSKRKISTTLGGANKTISFKDDKLFELVEKVVEIFELCGPNDIDFFYRDGRYYVSEINPRFGGAYLHAYGAGVDFVKMIDNNIHGIANIPDMGNYEEDVVMMMYDAVVIKKKKDLTE